MMIIVIITIIIIATDLCYLKHQRKEAPSSVLN